MPNKVVNELMFELKELQRKFQLHLEESGTIKTDIKWLKWLCMLIVGGLITLWFKK